MGQWRKWYPYIMEETQREASIMVETQWIPHPPCPPSWDEGGEVMVKTQWVWLSLLPPHPHSMKVWRQEQWIKTIEFTQLSPHHPYEKKLPIVPPPYPYEMRKNHLNFPLLPLPTSWRAGNGEKSMIFPHCSLLPTRIREQGKSIASWGWVRR